MSKFISLARIKPVCSATEFIYELCKSGQVETSGYGPDYDILHNYGWT